MKSLILAGMAALASVGVVSVADRNDAVQTAELTTGSTQKAADTKAFSISNLMAETACLAERGEPVTNRSQRFAADADCNRVWPGLGDATTWTRNEDGTIALANGSGEAIVTLVEGDGIAYEALDPPNALITVVAAD